MIRINLLPWREQKKREQKTLFALLLAASMLGGILLVMMIHLVMAVRISAQQYKNTILQSQIDEESVAIASMNVKMRKMQDMITQLGYLIAEQRTSASVVRLLDVLPRVVPDAVTLDSLLWEGRKITLTGKSLSSLQVTQFMERLEKSGYFAQPVLTEISGRESQTGEEKMFQLEVTQQE